MRKILMLLMILCLLAGCAPAEADPTVTQTPTVPQTTEAIPGLLDEKVPVEGSSALFEIHSEAAQSIDRLEQIYSAGDALLLTQVTLPDNCCCAQITEPVPVTMVLMDQRTGKALAQAQFTMDGFVKFQVGDDWISAMCWDTGLIKLFDRNLTLLSEYRIDPSWALTALDSTGTYAYAIPPQGTLVKTELATGKQEILIDGRSGLMSTGVHKDSVTLSWQDPNTQQSRFSCLDLKTGHMTPIPFGLNIPYADCLEGLWMGSLQEPGMSLLGRDEDPGLLNTPELYFTLIEGPAALYTVKSDETDQQLLAYGEDGSFFATTQCPTAYGYVCCPVWSDLQNGYFLFARTQDGTTKLLFWDVSQPGTGEALSLPRLSETDLLAG